MADRPGDRSVSVSSSITEAEAYDENEKNHSPTTDSSYVHMKTPEEMEIGDEERAELIPAAVHVVQEKATDPEKATVRSAAIWMVINTLATIGIVCLHLEAAGQRILMND
jgi:solute carrier family 35 protein E3